jgi:hypothetical protein
VEDGEEKKKKKERLLTCAALSNMDSSMPSRATSVVKETAVDNGGSAAVGLCEGAQVGNLDGERLGLSEGGRVTAAEGLKEGEFDEITDGDTDGWGLVRVVGQELGITVGEEGRWVGTAEGKALGERVGDRVGPVGAIVGAIISFATTVMKYLESKRRCSFQRVCMSIPMIIPVSIPYQTLALQFSCSFPWYRSTTRNLATLSTWLTTTTESNEKLGCWSSWVFVNRVTLISILLSVSHATRFSVAIIFFPVSGVEFPEMKTEADFQEGSMKTLTRPLTEPELEPRRWYVPVSSVANLGRVMKENKSNSYQSYPLSTEYWPFPEALRVSVSPRERKEVVWYWLSP